MAWKEGTGKIKEWTDSQLIRLRCLIGDLTDGWWVIKVLLSLPGSMRQTSGRTGLYHDKGLGAAYSISSEALTMMMSA